MSLWPFAGLDPFLQAFFGAALVLIVLLFCWTASLLVRGLIAARHPPPATDPGAFAWVFLVPALNEEVTIADSVERLMGFELAERTIVVIDDGSDDRTPDVLASLEAPGLTVLRRDPPDARRGKAEALNDAYRRLADIVGPEGRDRTIVCVVDADGRLHDDAPALVAGHFADPAVGGVQSLVRIYNRDRPLAWFEDVEFSIYGRLFQAGRNRAGTAGMGGNGQFNRLSALDSIADERGPWRDRLTEDQDLGLRLIAAGWHCRQELRAIVDQQGLSTLRPLLRQRTRWAQGNLQALGLLSAVARAPIGLVARAELLLQLLTPVWQAFIGASLATSIVLAVTGVADYWSGESGWQIVFFYLLGFGTVVFGCIAARAQEGVRGWVTGLLIAQPYGLYSWLLWPALARAAGRQLTAHGEWAKTEREPLAAPGVAGDRPSGH